MRSLISKFIKQLRIPVKFKIQVGLNFSSGWVPNINPRCEHGKHYYIIKHKNPLLIMLAFLLMSVTCAAVYFKHWRSMFPAAAVTDTVA